MPQRPTASDIDERESSRKFIQDLEASCLWLAKGADADKIPKLRILADTLVDTVKLFREAYGESVTLSPELLELRSGKGPP